MNGKSQKQQQKQTTAENIMEQSAKYTNLLNTHLYLISSGNSLRQQSNIVIGMFLAHNSARLNVQYTLSKHAHTLYFIYCTVVDIISFIFFSTAVVVFITIAYMFLLD